MRHGTTSAYKKCKCDDCKAAWSAYMKAYREANRESLRKKERAYHAANRVARNASRLAAYHANPWASRVARLRAWYGLTLEDYEALLASQDGACAICRTREPGGKGTWCVDHDHACCPGEKSCGKCVRGLLCANCNTGIGMLGDCPDRLQSAVRYITKFVTLRKL